MHTKKPWMAVSGLAPLGRGFTRSHVRVLGIVLAAALAVAGLSLAEGSGQASLALRGEPGVALAKTAFYDRQVRAAEIMHNCALAIAEERTARGIHIDPELDPNGTGLIGAEFTAITTTLGVLEAKRTTTNPAFAALMVRYFREARLQPGDVVAVGASGSFPALILATLAACKALDLQPAVIYSVGASMYGANIQQKRSFLADKRGQKIASEVLTVIDDPLLPGGLGSRTFDNDGMAARRRIMIDKGVLNEFFVDWYYSRKLGWEPTTGGPANLLIPPGSRSVAEIMQELGRGIYITGFIGGNSNSTTGDSSIGILGKLFENGVPVQSVAEMNIAGNHLEFWHKLIEAANDPWPYSSWRTPSLVFKEVVVSGV